MTPAGPAAATSERARFLRFLAAGGAAALVNVASRVVYQFATSYEVAIVLAYLTGMTTAYLLNRAFVFAPSGRGVREEYARFALVNVVALAQVWVVSVGLARLVFPALGMTWHADTLAHVIGVLVPAVTSYFGHKHLTFAAKT